MNPANETTDPQGSVVSASPPLETVPLRHYGRWLSAAVLAVLVAMLIHTLLSHINRNGVTNDQRFQWSTVGSYLFTSSVMHGALVTIELTAAAMAVGVIFGILLATMRLSTNRQLRYVSWVYLWFFRGTPVYVQLIFWANLAWLYPTLSIGVPFGPSFVTITTNDYVTNLFLVAVVGLALNEAAYMAEIVRAGIIAVDAGQLEAAQALGMRRAQSLRRIVLPQAMRVIVPPTGNETISMLKTTSLVGAALGGGGELYRSIQNIYNLNYLVPPLLITGCLWYLTMTSVLSVGQFYIERYYGRGVDATRSSSSKFSSTLKRSFGRSPHTEVQPLERP